MPDAKIIDFHVHAFPDALAPRAMKKLIDEAPGVKAYLDGTIGQLLDSMDKSGIEKAVLCCIATRPGQFDTILNWCRKIRSERIYPFPSIHPQDENHREKLSVISAEGFRGVKFHPYYQDFQLDDGVMMDIYDRAAELGLMVVVHTGYDIAFEYDRRGDSDKILKVLKAYPELKLITTHLGAWKQWDEVEEKLIGLPIYMEISFALDELEPQKVRDMLMKHPDDYILFGTDSPWTDQHNTLNLLKSLDLPAERLSKILHINAEKLLCL
ncbi:MAG: TatD family hydrolase [Phycisphaerae bacterium]